MAAPGNKYTQVLAKPSYLTSGPALRNLKFSLNQAIPYTRKRWQARSGQQPVS